MYLPNGNRAFYLFFCATLLVLACPGTRLMAVSDSASGTQVVYTPGGDVKAPKLLHYVEPDFASSSRNAFVNGVVRLSTVVTADGTPAEVKVVKGLNDEEDQEAVKAVTQWRFRPGTKSDKPVAVRLTVEVEFRLL